MPSNVGTIDAYVCKSVRVKDGVLYVVMSCHSPIHIIIRNKHRAAENAPLSNQLNHTPSKCTAKQRPE